MKNKYEKLLLCLGVVVGLDQTLKVWSRISGLAELNQGGVFGWFPGGGWLTVGMVVVILLLLVWWKLDNDKSVGLSIILASGISNLLDRFIWGGVWDYIHYPIIGVRANLADLGLVIGAIWLVLVSRNTHDRKKS